MLRYLAVSLRNAFYRLTRKRTIGVVGVIFRNNEVCLIKHSYAPGWYLPGGSIERNETPYQAVLREVFEETGVKAKSAKLMNVYSHFSRGWSNYVVCYFIDDFEMIVEAKIDSEIGEVRFFKVADLPLDIRPTAKRRIEEIVTGKIALDASW